MDAARGRGRSRGDPRDAVRREIFEETGLAAEVGQRARVFSAHLPQTWRAGRRIDLHAVRVVYEGWVEPDAPEPCVQEVGGSTVAARWIPLDDVASGDVAVTIVVQEALEAHRPHRLQRLAAYGLCLRDTAEPEVLLTRISAKGHHAGAWTLPGGGVRHGEQPSETVSRELMEECGLTGRVGPLLGIHDLHFTGVAPSGRTEDFHGIHLIYRVDVAGQEPPRVIEQDGTTDDAAWIPLRRIEDGELEVLDVVREALAGAGAGAGDGAGDGAGVGSTARRLSP